MQTRKNVFEIKTQMKPLSIASSIGFRFGEWAVFPNENRLQRGDEIVRLEPKVMQLLLTLVSRHNQACSRTVLLDQLWPSTDTDDSSLTRAISELRKALGDPLSPPRYIDTIHRIGYKAIAEIGPLIDEAEIAARDSTTARSLSPHEETVAIA